ncbi:MAG: hypothetical protein Q9227_004004 [Pyrenula ochraceoflavens]
MSERKVLTKYYPPDFDPSSIKRTPKHLRPSGPKTIAVRLMAPFGMVCLGCNNYIAKAKKFNARKEKTEENYLNIAIYRFFIRCPGCHGEISFKTDPANMDYTCESGAKRNFEPWRTSKAELEETTEQRLDRLEREEAEEADLAEKTAMEELEEKMMDSKREMQVADALDEIRTRNARIERGERGMGQEAAMANIQSSAEVVRLRIEEEDAEAARRAFSNAEKGTLDTETMPNTRGDEVTQAELEQTGNSNHASPPPPAVNHTFERTKKVKKPAISGLVKKTEPVKTALVQAPATATLGLGDYGSDSD